MHVSKTNNFHGRLKVKRKKSRDIEKAYPTKRFIEKLRRLADALETGEQFRIQVAGERINVPADAVINIEHERDGDAEELEFQLKWERK
jgi:amphi-Trp domain-containing protein